jgi:molybdopterin synthase sulfur carrier subunit
MITVHYFAGVKELTGTAQESVSLAGQTVAQLRSWLAEKYPGMAERSIQVAVNEEYALPDDVLSEGDVVALIPPVSGG